MLTITGWFLLLLFGYSASASNIRCFPLKEGGSLCFTQPDPPVALSWSSAMEWCKHIGGTLPIPANSYYHVIYGNALDYFGLHTETMWLGANSTYDLSIWYWTKEVPFTGTIDERYVPGKTHAYVVRHGGNMRLVAASPFDFNHYICQYSQSEAWCATYSNSLWTSGKCYIKYRYSSSWYFAWQTCGENGLASIDSLSDFSRWLDNLQPFWIGLRCTWWTWHDTIYDISYEVTESQFGDGLPDGYSVECLSSYRDSFLESIQWDGHNCNSNLQFICQQYVNPATTTSATAVAEAETAISSTKSASVSALQNKNDYSNSVNYAVPFGVAVGILGGLILAVTVWVSLLTSYTCKTIRNGRIFPI